MTDEQIARWIVRDIHIDCGDDREPRIDDKEEVIASIATALRAAYGAGFDACKEQAAEVAEAEPEMPGDPPADVLEAMMRIGPVANARSACRATKKSIANRIRALESKP